MARIIINTIAVLFFVYCILYSINETTINEEIDQRKVVVKQWTERIDTNEFILFSLHKDGTIKGETVYERINR